MKPSPCCCTFNFNVVKGVKTQLIFDYKLMLLEFFLISIVTISEQKWFSRKTLSGGKKSSKTVVLSCRYPSTPCKFPFLFMPPMEDRYVEIVEVRLCTSYIDVSISYRWTNLFMLKWRVYFEIERNQTVYWFTETEAWVDAWWAASSDVFVAVVNTEVFVILRCSTFLSSGCVKLGWKRIRRCCFWHDYGEIYLWGANSSGNVLMSKALCGLGVISRDAKSVWYGEWISSS